MNIKEIEDIKNQIEQRKQAIERAEGRKEQLLKSLSENFDCKDLEEAKEKLEQLKQEGCDIKEIIEKLSAKIEKLWNEQGNNNELS